MISRVLSIAHLSALDATPLDLIAAAGQAGFNAVGLRIVAPRPGEAFVPIVGDPQAIRAIKAECTARAVRVLDIEAVIISPQLDPETLAPAFETAAEIGARHVLTNMYVPDRQQGADAFAAVCAQAARFGLDVMLEFVPISERKTLDAAVETLRLADAPNGRLLIDALHLSRSGGSLADLAALPPSWLPYIHICDAPAAIPPREELIPEMRSGRLLPGEGELPLRALLAALPADTALAVEAPCRATSHLPVAERVARAGAALHKLLGAL